MSRRHDPIVVEVIRNELDALVDEMRTTVRRTGRSPMVKIGDFAVSLCDGRGRGLGVGQTNMMNTLFYLQVRRVLGAYGDQIRPGDVFMVNDPYAGGSHIPDVLIITPIFWDAVPVAFAVAYSHHTDMGGRFPGSQSGQCRNAFEEGVAIPLVRILEGGRRNEDLLRVVARNVRAREDLVGDVEAKIAGGWKAGERLNALLMKYGLEAFEDTCDFLNEYSERAMREAITEVADGAYRSQIICSDDGLGADGSEFPIVVTIKIDGDRMVIDFTGTSAQVAGGVNMPFENVRGVTYSTLRELLVPGLPLNDGLMRAVEVVSPPGTVTNPTFPAATAGRATVFFLVDEAIHRALAQALPDRVPVPREAWDVMHFSGTDRAGRQSTLMDLFSGGWGARPFEDGIDGVSQTPTLTIPAEIIEREFPIVVEGFGLEPDTAGAGRFRGSMGVFRSYRFRDAGQVMIRSNRLRPTAGLAGGLPGRSAVTRLIRDGKEIELPVAGYVHFECRDGDLLYHCTAGSGGFGAPAERDPAAVRADVREGRVSAAEATSRYGALIKETGKARPQSARNGSI